MKLFLYDQKHEQIHGEIDLGKIDDKQAVLLEKVIKFLDGQRITNRYKTLIVAESFKITYEDGEPEIEFSCAK